jgi:hypothetical protein
LPVVALAIPIPYPIVLRSKPVSVLVSSKKSDQLKSFPTKLRLWCLKWEAMKRVAILVFIAALLVSVGILKAFS